MQRALPHIAKIARLSLARPGRREAILRGTPDAVHYAQDLLEAATAAAPQT